MEAWNGRKMKNHGLIGVGSFFTELSLIGLNRLNYYRRNCGMNLVFSLYQSVAYPRLYGLMGEELKLLG